MDWRIFDKPVAYPEALELMETHVQQVIEGIASEQIWALEHCACYTAGTSAKADDLKEARFPVYDTGRGGQYTYHGPGQLIVYPILNIRERFASDVRQYVYFLEQWIIDVLAELAVKGERREGRIGIWVVQPDGREAKIAALGIRVRKGIAFHGFSINVNPDLTHFDGIVPCGISDHGVTSIKKETSKDVFLEVLEVVKKIGGTKSSL